MGLQLLTVLFVDPVTIGFTNIIFQTAAGVITVTGNPGNITIQSCNFSSNTGDVLVMSSASSVNITNTVFAFNNGYLKFLTSGGNVHISDCQFMVPTFPDCSRDCGTNKRIFRITLEGSRAQALLYLRNRDTAFNLYTSSLNVNNITVRSQPTGNSPAFYLVRPLHNS